MDRRRFLAAAGAAGLSLVPGCWSRETDGTVRCTPSRGAQTESCPSGTSRGPIKRQTTEQSQGALEARFETVVDAVADLGCDQSGEAACDENIRSGVADDTLLRVPPGEYLIESPLVFNDVANFGIVGMGADRGAVRFVHPRNFSHVCFNVRGGRGWHLENFTLQQTPDRGTNSGLVVFNEDGLMISNVEVAGFSPTIRGTPDLMVAVTDPDGTGEISGFRRAGGAEVGVYPAAWPGLICSRRHSGTLRLLDCHFEECGSNGVYASRTQGDVHIVGGLFKNSDVSQIRVSGEGSFIEGARIVVDTENTRNVIGEYDVVRGVWWEAGGMRETDVGGSVRNCEFVNRSAPTNRGLLEIDGSAGRMTVRNSRFRTEADGYRAILALEPGSSNMGEAPAKPWGIVIDNVDVTGGATGGAAIEITRRPGSVIENVDVVQEGRSRDGIVAMGSKRSRVARTSVRTTRYPVLVQICADDANCSVSLARIGELLTKLQPTSVLEYRSDSNDRFCADEFDLEKCTAVVTRPEGGPFRVWNADGRAAGYGSDSDRSS